LAAKESGYLQFVSYAKLIEIAESFDAVIRLLYTPGHFVLAGRPIARVAPAGAAAQVEAALSKAHVTGPHRTLIQDPVFAIDQLVEIAVRALSPAVNDPFTAMTCIDWITAGLSEISARDLTEGIYFGSSGKIRLIETEPNGIVKRIEHIGKSGAKINGGFMVLRQEIFHYMREGDDLVEEPFRRLIEEGKLMTYSHDGFWACMDTFKEKQDLEDAFSRGDAPWAVWNSPSASTK